VIPSMGRLASRGSIQLIGMDHVGANCIKPSRDQDRNEADTVDETVALAKCRDGNARGRGAETEALTILNWRIQRNPALPSILRSSMILRNRPDVGMS